MQLRFSQELTLIFEKKCGWKFYVDKLFVIATADCFTHHFIVYLMQASRQKHFFQLSVSSINWMDTF